MQKIEKLRRIGPTTVKGIKRHKQRLKGVNDNELRRCIVINGKIHWGL
jgi:hypothetical protein